MLLLSDFSHVDSKCLAPIPRTLGSERLAVVDPVKNPCSKTSLPLHLKMRQDLKTVLWVSGVAADRPPLTELLCAAEFSLPHFPSGPERPSGPCRGNPRTTGQDAMGAVISRGQNHSNGQWLHGLQVEIDGPQAALEEAAKQRYLSAKWLLTTCLKQKRSLASWKLNTDYL